MGKQNKELQVAGPSNTDIIKLLTMNHEETSKRLDGVEQQVKHTNGRVKAMETRWERVDAVEEYRKQEAQSGSNPKVDWQKLMLYALGLVSAALGLVGMVLAN